MFYCRLYIARKSFEKLNPEVHTINILRQLFGNTCRHIDTCSLQFPNTRCRSIPSHVCVFQRPDKCKLWHAC